MKRSLGRKTQAGRQSAGGDPNDAQAERRRRIVVWQRRIIVAVLIVAVFAVAGLAGSVVRTHKNKTLATPSAGASPSGLSISVPGRSPVVLTVWEDLRSPASKQFLKEYGPTLDHLLSTGLVTIHYREITSVDKERGGDGSLHAGNALACSQDTKQFPAYRSVLYAHQPADESDDAFSNTSYLVKLAKQVKGLDSDIFRTCVDGVGHTVWVKKNQEAYQAAGFSGLPAMQMEVVPREAETGQSNIRTLLPETVGTAKKDRLTPARLKAEVLKAAEAAPTATSSASASSGSGE
jgi:uncharacterized membrane protein